MTFNFARDIVRPVIVPVVGFVVAATVIITIGEILLRLYDHSVLDELRRRELWFGVFLALAVLGVATAIVLKPSNPKKPDVLDREVVIGHHPMFESNDVTPVDDSLRSGDRGSGPELWIPIEAVLDVFPETQSAFLAIMGDEAEAFGWDKPPQSFNRALFVQEPPKTL